MVFSADQLLNSHLCLQAKLHGTIVTLESFEEWKTKFMQEMEVKVGFKGVQTTKLTGESLLREHSIHHYVRVSSSGRQMFERDASLALSDAQFLQSNATPLQ